jgi:hypothetical protein
MALRGGTRSCGDDMGWLRRDGLQQSVWQNAPGGVDERDKTCIRYCPYVFPEDWVLCRNIYLCTGSKQTTLRNHLGLSSFM